MPALSTAPPAGGGPGPLRLQVASYNFNLQGCANPFPDFQSWLVPTLSETRNEYSATSLTQGRDAPDLYAVGFQELLPLHLAFADGQAAAEVRSHAAREVRRAVRHHAAVTRVDGKYPPGAGPEDYTLVGEAHLVGISLFVFGRNRSGIPARVKEARATTASAGFFNLLGNKGAVAVRLVLGNRPDGGNVGAAPSSKGNAEQDEVITFVCAHLTAHDHNVPRRNQDFQTIVQRLAFTPGTAVRLPSVSALPLPSSVDLTTGAGANTIQELHAATEASGAASTAPTHESKARSVAATAATKRVTGAEVAVDDKTYGIYDCHHVFFFGDLNYRIALDKKGGGLTKEDVRRKVKQGDHAYLAKHDQLSDQMSKGKTFHGFVEPPLSKTPFGPTYKFKPQRASEDGVENSEKSSSEKDRLQGKASPKQQELSAKRVPGWTDRILWASNQAGGGIDGQQGSDPAHGVEVELYRSIMGYTISDHKPVTLLASLPHPRKWSTRLAPYRLDPSHAFYRNIGWALDRLVGYTWCALVAIGAGKVVIGVAEVVVIAFFSFWWLRSGFAGEGGDLGYWFANLAARGGA
ncbi:unnamed protein product [Parajaminaea phylloscopi]